MAGAIITLTTDFGLTDPFVGIMKGVILAICPEARLVDLTHEIPPQDVRAGALALESAAPYFPFGTIHLAVVDPGVGSARRGLVLAAGGQLFVGPDNGLFTPALAGADWRAVALADPTFWLSPVSRTFHGRDVFAPVAGHLAAGVPMTVLGPAVTDPVRVQMPEWRMEGADLVGEVIGADRFGNLLTSITVEGVARVDRGLDVTVLVGQHRVAGLARSYADGPATAPAAIIGSAGRLEIFVKNGCARDLLGAGPGTRVTVRRGGSGRGR